MEGRPDFSRDLLLRLKTIRGHIAGIERMIEEEKSCSEILIQLAAIRSSISHVAASLLEHNAVTCLRRAAQSGENMEETVTALVREMVKFLK